MKCFMPVYALALTLAVTSNMFAQVSAADCVEAEVCTIAKPCVTVADGNTPKQLVKADGGLTTACPDSKFAYIKSLTVVPDVAQATATAASDIKVAFTKDGSSSSLSSTAASTVSGSCTNTYASIGADATKDVLATIGCTTGTNCSFKYRAEWACQTPSCAAITCGTGSTGCETVAPTNSAPTEIKRPATNVLAECGDGKYAYLASLDVGVTGTATTASEVTVAFTYGNSTALAATKDSATCDGKWTDVGKTTATGDVKATIVCSDTTTPCDVKYKAVWACQTVAVTVAPTPAPTNATTNSTTAPPSATPKASGVTALTGANPLVVWGTTLVAAVAGANFAAAL